MEKAKHAKKNRRNKDDRTTELVLITAILNLIRAVLDIIKYFTG